jgi:hypothetical protein
VIAAVGTIVGAPYYHPSKHSKPYPRDNAYPNHIRVAWDSLPRDRSFKIQVFGMQAIHEIPRDRFRTLVLDGPKITEIASGFPDDLWEPEKFSEGARKVVTVNAYERDGRARRACLVSNGYRCKVCEMSFEEVYGAIGLQFIHVHHLKPLALRKNAYAVNPKTDLVPVCPNCHAMLHTADPPLTIAQLRAVLKRTRHAFKTAN